MYIQYLLLLLYFSEGISQDIKQYCKQNCESCDLTSKKCSACAKGYQLSINGQCIDEKIIPHCQLYGIRSVCIVCQPTYRLLDNKCVRMYDGCLISGPSGLCSKCLQGAYRNKYGKCDISTLNCVRQGQNGTCQLCAQGYKLTTDFKCQNFDEGCTQIQLETGLCLDCSPQYTFFQYRCLNNSNIIENCEVMSSDFGKCTYCKSGYYTYYGNCYSQNLLNYMLYNGQPTIQCKERFYYNKQDKICVPQPNNCDKFDYGLLTCASCLSINILLDGICRDPSLRFCLSYSIDPNKCLKCKENFYVSEQGLCLGYPPFCQQVSYGKCISCISSFLLNSQGNCEDPNCENFNAVTNECDICKFSYFKNEQGICSFKDLYCEQWQNTICKKCRIHYVFDPQTSRCKFVDPDCEIFSDQDICIKCRQGYYENKNTNLCMELPPFCLKADDKGNCELCVNGYALLTTYECFPISNISNCLAQSKKNEKYCLECKKGYFVQNGICKQLPLMCLQYNEKLKKCKKCSENSKLRNGFCYDSNCEVFAHNNAQCLGCKQNFQFGSKGECIPQQNDPNCKEFLYGQCKKCSARHYFNKFWKCVKVSSLCKDYDSNNGKCTSCYPGYVVQKGNCIRESQQNVCAKQQNRVCVECISGYVLKNQNCFKKISGCQQMDQEFNRCEKCEIGYTLQENFGICLSTNLNSDDNCLASDELGNCQKCISRMFIDPDTGICRQVNLNCKNYMENGKCIECYDGYSINPVTFQCIISSPKDPNCKISFQQICEECYDGYYFEESQGKCVVFDALCRQSNKKNGKCLSCWSGYQLAFGKCLIASQISIFQASNCKESQNENGIVICTQCETGFLLSQGKCILKIKEDLNCIEYDQSERKCVKCAFGAVFDISENKCEYPLYGEDDNCIQYRDKMCVKCLPYHVLSSFKCQPLDKNCLSYDYERLTCLKCTGNMKPKKLQCV